MSNHRCPACGTELKKVTRGENSPLNQYQFDAVKAGEWFCECHDNGRGNAPFAYYWTKDLESGPTHAGEKGEG